MLRGQRLRRRIRDNIPLEVSGWELGAFARLDARRVIERPPLCSQVLGAAGETATGPACRGDEAAVVRPSHTGGIGTRSARHQAVPGQGTGTESSKRMPLGLTR